MTTEDKKNYISRFCNTMGSYKNCPKCPINSICTSCFGAFGANHEKETDEAYNVLCNLNNHDNEDNVNHPKHYCRDDGMECIDEMILVFGERAVMTYCLLNTWKYRYRAADKNGEEDLKKSDWYMRKYQELKEIVDNE